MNLTPPLLARLFALVIPALGIVPGTSGASPEGDRSWTVHLRQRSAKSSARPVERATPWDPRKTALIVCDMWDDHWCRSAARRVVELAGPMKQIGNALCNAVVTGDVAAVKAAIDSGAAAAAAAGGDVVSAHVIARPDEAIDGVLPKEAARAPRK